MEVTLKMGSLRDHTLTRGAVSSSSGASLLPLLGPWPIGSLASKYEYDSKGRPRLCTPGTTRGT
jgi:hypothetical protein